MIERRIAYFFGSGALSRRVARSILAIGAAAATLVACGPVAVDDGLARYRERVEETLARRPTSEEAHPASDLLLPRRRERRIEVAGQQIGPFDFLAIIGCPLSEVVAERNSALGRILEPTRRLAHEQRVLAAGEECLSSLGEERAARLRTKLDAKRDELGAHVWNAVWLDEELERFLSTGPRNLIGGEDASDGAWQIERIAAALANRSPEKVDAALVEQALAELRDDPAALSTLRVLDRSRLELDRVAGLLEDGAEKRSGKRCDRETRRLVAAFRESYLPLQAGLGALDRRAGALLAALDALYRASASFVEVPAEMRRFGETILDVESREGLWQRYRAALVRHAGAWEGPLQRCGELPRVTRPQLPEAPGPATAPASAS